MAARIVLLCCFIVFCDAAFVGEKCTFRGGVEGVCTLIPKCKAAIAALMRREPPVNCGYDGPTPIVCCIDNVQTTVRPQPLATTQKIPSTTMYVPEIPHYDDGRNGGCDAIDPTMTSAKTGQKAFDKCVEYQEKYVYPCEKSVALGDDKSRSNHCHHNADELIIGGNETKTNEFPHMAMLGYGENEQSIQWLCGGSIISEKYILTAGHCVSTRNDGEVKYVLIGAQTRSDANNPANVYKVKRIIRHPNYQPPSKYNDILLLETEKTIALSQFVVPACLHVGDAVNDTRVLATGWGLTEYKGSVSEVMQKVIIEKFNSIECGVKYPVHRNMKQGFDPETQICYGDRNEAKDTCQGDSGGPIQIKSKRLHCMYVIVGVTSFGRACGFPAEPAIYTRVAHYVPWIESIVWP